MSVRNTGPPPEPQASRRTKTYNRSVAVYTFTFKKPFFEAPPMP